MFEVEQKFRVDDTEALAARLDQMGATCTATESHCDTYYRHPSRDFVKTNEALRIRRVDSIASVTYKGPKLAVDDATLKVRQEIEWCLAPNDTDGSQMAQLLAALGFATVAAVKKRRRSYQLSESETGGASVTVTIDQVARVGNFAEIEILVEDQDTDEASMKAASELFDVLANQLGLGQRQRASYLEMLLALD